MARDHRAGEEVEPHPTRMGELLRSRHRHEGIPGGRQLHRCAVTPVVALQAQGQATQGRGLSTLETPTISGSAGAAIAIRPVNGRDVLLTEMTAEMRGMR